MRILKPSFILFVILVLPFHVNAQSFRAGSAFWTPPKSTGQCKSSYSGIGKYTLSTKLTRRSYPNDDGRNFAGHYGMWLADTIAGRSVAKHKANILKIASANTYTKANMKPGWSPIYIQSNLIRITAMYITVMQSRGQLSDAERQVLIAWGDKMIPGQKQSRGNKSADSLMASGVAMIAWGNIKGDSGLMKTGYRKFMSGFKYVSQTVGKLKRHSGHAGIPLSRLSLEDEYNVALQHAVEGAAILRNLGIDVTSKKFGQNNLQSAVAWWGKVAASKPKGFKGYRSWSHNYHLGWIPIYLRMFPKNPESGQLGKLARSVSGGRSPSFRAISLGGATDCLW